MRGPTGTIRGFHFMLGRCTCLFVLLHLRLHGVERQCVRKLVSSLEMLEQTSLAVLTREFGREFCTKMTYVPIASQLVLWTNPVASFDMCRHLRPCSTATPVEIAILNRTFVRIDLQPVLTSRPCPSWHIHDTMCIAYVSHKVRRQTGEATLIHETRPGRMATKNVLLELVLVSEPTYMATAIVSTPKLLRNGIISCCWLEAGQQTSRPRSGLGQVQNPHNVQEVLV